MKIQKFGTINFTDSLNLPIFSGFTFSVESESEQSMTQDKKLKTLIMVTAIRDHLSKVVKFIEEDISKASLRDSGDFSTPVGKSTKSPEEIVSESLSRIMAK
ncbi:hypothetical protein SP058_00210 [Salmonella phage FSL SP-058]|uniref:Uncharacterized protein n=1 Tax=Salmonella phage FSL SP-058 TaxID=1173761 RepID=S4TTM1_9CAUD|nr:hypothetical protein SP058_00210 [Salmonella phage FSL SP-058]AGF88157.1 hypothetical protein SP058_00210 [Salmonella phage FSL SP-058]